MAVPGSTALKPVSSKALIVTHAVGVGRAETGSAEPGRPRPVASSKRSFDRMTLRVAV